MTGSPSSSSRPEVGWSSPAAMRIRVDLPHPEGPMTQTNSRRWTPKLMPLRAVTSPSLPANTLPSASTESTTGRSPIARKRSRIFPGGRR